MFMKLSFLIPNLLINNKCEPKLMIRKKIKWNSLFCQSTRIKTRSFVIAKQITSNKKSTTFVSLYGSCRLGARCRSAFKLMCVERMTPCAMLWVDANVIFVKLCKKLFIIYFILLLLVSVSFSVFQLLIQITDNVIFGAIFKTNLKKYVLELLTGLLIY